MHAPHTPGAWDGSPPDKQPNLTASFSRSSRARSLMLSLGLLCEYSPGSCVSLIPLMACRSIPNRNQFLELGSLSKFQCSTTIRSKLPNVYLTLLVSLSWFALRLLFFSRCIPL